MSASVRIRVKELMEVNVKGEKKNLAVLAGIGSVRLFEAHPLVDAFNARNRTNLSVVPHLAAHAAVTVGETWRRFPACTVDALIAHEAPGTAIGENIVFSEQGEPKVVQAAGPFKGRKDIALVAQCLTSSDVAYLIGRKQRSLKEILEQDGLDYLLALDYQLDVKEILQFATDRLVVVPDFRCTNGWREPHAETGVPSGNDVTKSREARYLHGIIKTSYVGRVVRGADCYGDGNYVCADWAASGRLGVVAEVPEADVVKIRKFLKQAEARRG